MSRLHEKGDLLGTNVSSIFKADGVEAFLNPSRMRGPSSTTICVPTWTTATVDVLIAQGHAAMFSARTPCSLHIATVTPFCM